MRATFAQVGISRMKNLTVTAMSTPWLSSIPPEGWRKMCLVKPLHFKLLKLKGQSRITVMIVYIRNSFLPLLE